MPQYHSSDAGKLQVRRMILYIKMPVKGCIVQYIVNSIQCNDHEKQPIGYPQDVYDANSFH